MDITPNIKTSRKKSGNSRKIGRNVKVCAKYRLEGRREKNKARKAIRNAKRQEKLDRLREKRAKIPAA